MDGLSGRTITGSIGTAAQSNVYRFSTNANDFVDFTIAATTGSLSPRIRLYNSASQLLDDAANRSTNGACSGGSSLELIRLPSRRPIRTLRSSATAEIATLANTRCIPSGRTIRSVQRLFFGASTPCSWATVSTPARATTTSRVNVPALAR
jgi:hypothetical protein